MREKESLPPHLSPSALAVGFFDGVHKGHQQVILTAQRKASELGVQSAVMTFDPHPSVVLNRSVEKAKYITPLKEKEQIIENLGIDTLFVVHFDRQLASLPPEDFVESYFISLNVRHVAAGFDFTFGFKGKGTMHLLPEYAQGRFTTSTIEQVSDEGEKISSTRIRRLLDEGNVSAAGQLLSRPLTITGEVVTGDRRGHTIGYPTANISLNHEYYLPKNGVYAVTVNVGNELYKGMANLGYKPTFNGNKRTLEIHIFDFHRDIYGNVVRVHFRQFIRSENKFNGVDELVRQLNDDELKTRRLLK
nr:bifunctional riboflavin kinase/FAD synthetase [Halobacillus sp. A5]